MTILKILVRTPLLFVLVMILTACGGGSSGGTDTPVFTASVTTYRVDAVFVKGLVTGATCELFEVANTGASTGTSTGTKSSSIASGSSTAGRVAFGTDIEYTGVALIECEGGTYIDEATGATLTAPFTRAVVDIDESATFTVSPLTEIATQLAEADGDLSLALTTYNQQVAEEFGLDFDITLVEPTDLDTTVSTNDDSGDYATALALISQLDENSVSDISELVDELADDLGDGSFSDEKLQDLSQSAVDLLSSEVSSNLSEASLDEILVSLDNIAPSGYSISDLTNPIDGSTEDQIGFSISGAEVGAIYHYSIQSSVSGTGQTQSSQGNILSTDFSLTDIDVSSLEDGVITVEFYIEDQAGNIGSTVSAEANKNTLAVEDAVVVSGTISFDLVPHNTSTNGLDYDATTAEVARGVRVEAVNESDEELASTLTDEQGDYSFVLSSNTDVRIRVKAEMLNSGSASWDVRVTDNTNSNALYALQGSLVNTGTEDAIRDLHADSGWTGFAYNNPRAAGPFAILDSIYATLQKFAAADGDISFPELEIRWSTLNNTASGDYNEGDIGTSFYNGTAIYILGDADSDTDEYDSHIVVHEWGHYFEDRLSRSDSIGGSHSTGDKLDLRVAFGEGWGNALSGMILDDSVYRDSSGNNQAFGFSIDVDDNANSSPGWFSEGSVQSILYDLYDADEDGADAIELGLEPLYAALIDSDYKDEDYFTSIFSFVNELKIQQPDSVAAIDSLLLAQTIDGEDSDGNGETNDGGNADVLPVYKSVVINGSAVSVCSTDSEGEYNKLGVRDFVYLSIPSTDTYTIDVIKTSGSTDRDPDLVIWQSGTWVDTSDSDVTDQETWVGALSAGNYLIEFYDWEIAENDSSGSQSGCYDLTVTNI